MARVKISELNAKTTIESTDLLPIVDTINNETKKTSTGDLLNYIEENIDLPDVYSTSEIKTNKVWTDNKPIYRKIVDTGNIGDGALYVGGYSVDLNISNLDKVVRFEAYGIALADYIVSINTHTWYEESTNKMVGIHTLINPYGYFNCILDNNEVPTHLISSYVIVEYTKTTD